MKSAITPLLPAPAPMFTNTVSACPIKRNVDCFRTINKTKHPVNTDPSTSRPFCAQEPAWPKFSHHRADTRRKTAVFLRARQNGRHGAKAGCFAGT